jgi:hypothetical protein
MRSWWQEGPVRMAMVVAILNIELVVIPFFLKGLLGLSGWSLKIITVAWATSEIFFWIWFLDWVVARIKETEPVQEAIDLSKEIAPQLKNSFADHPFAGRVEDLIKRHLIDKFNPEKYKRKKLFTIIRRCGYVLGLPFLFCLGLFPFGIWILGIVIAKISQWRLGLVAVVLGNAVKAGLYATGYDHLWEWLGF